MDPRLNGAGAAVALPLADRVAAREPRVVSDFRNFDLNLLRVLDGVLREGTLSNAAKALNLSQPTISTSLARLREILQDELFVRSGTACNRRLAPWR
jgi:Bacterial regulatory helix-turn-helix protein, lysR family